MELSDQLKRLTPGFAGVVLPQMQISILNVLSVRTTGVPVAERPGLTRCRTRTLVVSGRRT
jgi:hypothetical protein